MVKWFSVHVAGGVKVVLSAKLVTVARVDMVLIEECGKELFGVGEKLLKMDWLFGDWKCIKRE